jgi:class 3 adenylate cyclase/tetratricopeptide (TPR) repeat protein
VDPSHQRDTDARGERRQLTVMFCDLVGFTRLAERTDPEDLQELLRSYHATCSAMVSRFDGYVAQYLGDGFLAYFGYPIAHEDDAERAVRSAFAIQRQLREGLQAGAVRARIGIHTGVAVVAPVGSEARREVLALGSTTNIAARVQELAEEGGVAISEATYRLTTGVFAHDLGRRVLKGVRDPLRIYSVHGVSDGIRRRGSAPETVMFGRGAEERYLLGRVEEARNGRGRVVWISGDPGIGKSRIVLELRDHPSTEPRSWIEMSCSPYTSGSALRPVIEVFAERLGFRDTLHPAERTELVAQRLAQVPNVPLERTVPYLLALLGLPAHDAYPLSIVTPEQQRERTMEALVEIVRALAAQQLLVLAVEDLHWADPSTLEFLGRLVEVASETRLLVLCTARSEFALPWQAAHVEQLQLPRLQAGPTRELIAALAGEGRFSPAVIQKIAERSDGVPLFIEQLTHAIAESPALGEKSESTLHGAIPDTLHGTLLARFDKLGSAKRVAQLAAAIGREFTEELLEQLGELRPDAVRDGMARLVQAGQIIATGDPAQRSYRFKHALFQDIAYQSLLRSDRRATHRRVAAALESRPSGEVGTDPAVLARHYSEAQLYAEAATHYHSAGVLAAARYANLEAVTHLRLALGALLELPETEQRRRTEMTISLALAQPLIASLTLDHAEVESLHERIASLCRAAEPGSPELPGLLYLSRYYLRRGQVAASAELGASILRIARGAGIPLIEAIGHLIVGTGEITRSPSPIAIDHLECALAITASTPLPAPADTLEPDLLTFTHATLALALAVGGRFDDAAAHARAARARALAVGHQPTLILTIALSTVTFSLMAEFETALAWAREALALAEGRGFHSPEAQAHVMAGWSRVALGDPGGVAEAEAGLAKAIEMGFRGGLCHHIQAAAEANRIAGYYERAEHLLALARQVYESTGEAALAGRVRRSLGMLHLSRGDLKNAEAEFLAAFDSLGANGARTEQLMTATELLRLARGRADEHVARARLADLYAGLAAEGTYGPQREAKALLTETA